ncbi:MAG: hypothetical protein KME10_02695 [Plectolyngbya sp. WJT66-NPBG17]|jgi:hypothetical protein|nr:hypothetical protein [Plectolyngbya sp. WJT66-NPBG17]
MQATSYPEVLILGSAKSFIEFGTGDLIDLATRSDDQDVLFLLVTNLAAYRHLKALIPQAFATGELLKPITLQHRDFAELSAEFEP